MNLRYASPADQMRIWRHLSSLPLVRDGVAVLYRVIIEELRPTRSNQQNARLWALMTAISQQAPAHMGGEWHAPEVWHEYCKRRWLGVEAGPFGEGVPRSTARLKVGEFNDYMEQIEAWAIDHFPGFDFDE